jgi:cyclase
MIEKIADRIYVETGVKGCNHGFVVTDEGVVMIDTPYFPANALRWRDEIARFGPVRYIINTEPHVDHFAGNTFFEGTVVAHKGAAGMVMEKPLQDYIDLLAQEEPQSLPLPEGYSFLTASVTLSERMILNVGKRSLLLTHFPGHTPYQVAVFLPEEKVLFSSDNIVVKTIPFITPQALPFKWLESLKKMQKMDIYTVIPGHGNISDKSCIPAMIDEIQLWLDTVSAAMKKGMSLQEIQQNVSLRDRYAKAPMPAEVLTRTHDMNLITVYRALRKQSKP